MVPKSWMKHLERHILVWVCECKGVKLILKGGRKKITFPVWSEDFALLYYCCKVSYVSSTKCAQTCCLFETPQIAEVHPNTHTQYIYVYVCINTWQGRVGEMRAELEARQRYHTKA